MRLLVDTHCWLWYLESPQKLGSHALQLMMDDKHSTYLSVVSIWEIVIKHGLGKLDLPHLPSQFIPRRMVGLAHRPLNVSMRHVLQVESLPLHHRDPFDRLLIAQAQCENFQLMTADQKMTAYDVDLIWAGPGNTSDSSPVP